MSVGWRRARREIFVAAALVTVLGASAWAVDGPTAAGFVVVFSAAVSLIVLRTLIPADQPQEPAGTLLAQVTDQPLTSFSGFWRMQTDLIDATRSLSAWDYSTRPRLANLLAARLAERHGISLADEPGAARQLLLGPSGHSDLWYWIDPERPTPPDAGARAGIPPRTLAALINRLEKL